MGMLKLAIIDDGVCAEKLSTAVNAYAVVEGEVIEDAGTGEIQESSHGTFCAKIIEKYCPSSIEFISIRALRETGFGDLDDMVTALKWCLNREIAIINLSNGVSQYTDIKPLYDVCYELSKKGVIIAAAQNNKRISTYPADFPFVLGVESSDTLNNPSLMKSNVYTKSDHKIIYKDKEKITQICNSYACAFATAQHAAMTLGVKKTYSSHTELNYRLSDNAVQWLDNRISVDDYLNLCEKHSNEVPFEQQYDIVIDNKFKFSDLENKLDNIRSVICYGRLPDDFKDKCNKKGILYWDSNYDFGKNRNRKFDIPIILVKTSGKTDEFEPVIELTNYFRKEQYVPAILSDIQGACNYGCFFSSTRKLTLKLNAMLRYLEPDIVFIVSGANKIKIEYDILVEKTDKRYVISYEGKTEVSEDTQSLFSALKRILSE